MKKIILIIFLSVTCNAFSQVIINADAATAKTTPSSATSVLLEFGNDNNKGIILPYVETIPTFGGSAAKGGTLIFDISTTMENPNGEFKVKVKNENDTGWTDLSGESGYSTTVANIVQTPQANPLVDAPNAKAIIGATTSTSDGVLILEASNKAMILPIVDNYTNILNPSPGMMAFLKGATVDKHRLIVFNGKTWAFWAANP